MKDLKQLCSAWASISVTSRTPHRTPGDLGDFWQSARLFVNPATCFWAKKNSLQKKKFSGVFAMHFQGYLQRTQRKYQQFPKVARNVLHKEFPGFLQRDLRSTQLCGISTRGVSGSPHSEFTDVSAMSFWRWSWRPCSTRNKVLGGSEYPERVSRVSHIGFLVHSRLVFKSA